MDFRSGQKTGVAKLDVGDHACCIYGNEMERSIVMVEFVGSGLARNHRILCLVDGYEPGAVLKELKDNGVSVQSAVDSGQLSVVTAEAVYLSDGVFSPDRMLELLESETDKAVAEGYTALSITGDASFALHHIGQSRDLVHYESMVNGFFPGNRAVGICFYDKNTFPQDILMSILDTHPYVMVGTELVQNAFFVPHGEYDWKKGAPDTLDKRLSALRTQGITFMRTLRQARDVIEIAADMQGVLIRLVRSSDGVYSFDFITDNIERLSGYGASDFTGPLEQFPPVHEPAIRNRMIEAFEKSAETGLPVDVEHPIITTDGVEKWLRTVGSPRKQDDGSVIWNLLAVDVTESVKKRENLAAKKRLLKARTDVITCMLQAGEIRHSISEITGILGRAVGVDRVCVFRNHVELPAGQLLVSCVSEWRRDGVEPCKSGLQDLEREDFPGYAELVDGQLADSNLVSLNPEPRRVLELMGLQSILAVSVSTSNEWWGVICLGCCDSKRVWSQDERDVLETTAKVLGDRCAAIQTAEELAVVRQRYSELFEHMPDGVAVYKAVNDGDDFAVVAFNRAAEEIDGVARDRIVDRRVTDVLPWSVESGLLKALRTVWHTGQDQYMGPVFLSSERDPGSWREFRIYRLSNDDVVTVFRDVTQQIMADQRLETERDRARTYLDIAPAIILGLDLEGRITLLNRAGARILECSEEDVIGKDWFATFIPEEIREDVRDIFKRNVNSGLIPVETVENEIVTAKGNPRIIRWSNTMLRGPDGSITESLCVGQDITEVKKVSDALSESENRYRRLVEHSPDLVYIYSSRKGAIYWSPRVTEILGYTQNDMRDNPAIWNDSIHPDDRDKVTAFINDPTLSRGAFIEYRVKHKLGRWHWLYDRVIDRRVTGDEIIIEGHATDVTERKEAEQALLASEEKYRRIVELADEGIWVIDAESKTTFVNPKMAEMLGYSVSEMDGRDLFDFMTEESRAICAKHVGLRKDGIAERHDFEFLRKDGSRLYASLGTSPVFDDDGVYQGALAVVLDVGDRREKEQVDAMVQNMQRLESIGALAGGIAHDFNNMLGAVMTSASLIASHIADRDKVVRYADRIKQTVQRASHLTDQLLTFSRGGNPVRKVCDMNEVIRGSAEFADSGASADLVFDIAPDLMAANVDAGQIGQVIQNMVLNACQSMSRGGSIRIEAWNSSLAASNVHALPPGMYVAVRITDEGCGIPEENIGKIFDPFFTTRPDGHGLGLSVAYSIVKNHGGAITVESEKDRGATFEILLPAIDEIPEKDTRPESHPVSVGKGKLLVMDDDEPSRETIAEFLRDIGFEVVCAPEGETAVSIYTEAMKSGTPFDVAVLDLTVKGGMGGEDTIRELIEADPDVKAIVASGYSHDSVMANHREYGFGAVVEKPFEVSELLDAVSMLMEGEK